MAVDSLTLSLSLSGTIQKTNLLPLVATALTADNGSAANVTRVEFQLLYGAVGGSGGLKNVKKVINQTSASPTGTYTASFPASDLAEPGVYAVRARAITESGSPVVVSVFLTKDSEDLIVLDANGADEFNVLTDTLLSELQNNSRVIWEQVTVTGTQIKAATGANSGTSKTVKLATLPANAILVGGAMVVNTADNGTASTTTATLGANSTAFDELIGATTIRSTGETGVAATFVPNRAGGVDLSSVLTVTGASQTIANIADGTSVTFHYGYVVPKSRPFGV